VLNLLRSFFNFIFKTDRFLRENQLWKMNGFILIFIGLIFFGAVTSKIGEYLGWEVINKPFVFLYGTFIYSTVPYLFFKSGKLKKYIIFGKKEGIEEVVTRFDSRAYIIFVLFFTYFLIYPLIGIPLIFNIFHISALVNYIWNNVVILMLALLAITSILWFSYHLVSSKVKLQKIKTKVALYTAIGTTFTLFNLKTFKYFTVAISCLLVSYLWIQYLIEVRTEEIKTGMENNSLTQDE